MQKILNAICLVGLCATFASCVTTTNTAKTAELSNEKHSATVVDLKVADKRISHTLVTTPELRRGGDANVRRAVIDEALKVAEKQTGVTYDLLVEPEFVVEKKNYFLVNKISKITVSGRPANYTNFRSLPDSVWSNPVFRGSSKNPKGMANASGLDEAVDKLGNLVKLGALKNGVRNVADGLSKKLHKTNAGSDDLQQEIYGGVNFRPKGYAGFITAEFGCGFLHANNNYGKDSSTGAILSLTTTHGYRINPKWFAGIGTGIIYDPGYANAPGYFGAINIPIYAAVRYMPRGASKNSFFIDARFGGSIMPAYQDYEAGGGFYFSPSVGWSFCSKKNGNKAFEISIAYTTYGSKHEEGYRPTYYQPYGYGYGYGHDSNAKLSQNAVTLRLGFAF